ncbi:unnamed protein product [Larinioides sclopetarius]|uniref:Uncharacterized protein n=1 Tax=Larinioides sclopetarius TaxID=280406 RepID=A0AAV1ZVY4_9ARAC
MPTETRKVHTPFTTLMDVLDVSNTLLMPMDSVPPSRPTSPEPLPAPQQLLSLPVLMLDQLPLSLSST